METKNYKGFTLLEALLYIAVLAIIITVVGSFFLWVIRSNTKARVVRETLDNSRRAIETMSYEIKEAESIYSPTTDSDQLSLETTKHLPTGEETSYIDFFLCGDRLCMKKESQDPTATTPLIALTSDQVEVSKFVFTQITTGSVPSVQIDLKIDYKNPNNRQEYQSSVETVSTVSMRSY
jgi:type II secretory pathway pseudopilin PulG